MSTNVLLDLLSFWLKQEQTRVIRISALPSRTVISLANRHPSTSLVLRHHDINKDPEGVQSLIREPCGFFLDS